MTNVEFRGLLLMTIGAAVAVILLLVSMLLSAR